MYPARRYSVPAHIALVYDFVNSRDDRHFLLNGVRRVQRDSFATPRELQKWLVDHGLLDSGMKVSPGLRREAVAIRERLRSLLSHAPATRRTKTEEGAALEKSLRRFPVVIGWDKDGRLSLQGCSRGARGAVAVVLTEVYHAAIAGELDRLKVCPARECHWVFFDRTKPNTGKWCDPAICGNREKKRAYRQRKKG